MYKINTNDIGDGTSEHEIITDEDSFFKCGNCGVDITAGYFCKEGRVVYCDDCEKNRRTNCDFNLELRKYTDHWHTKALIRREK